LTLDRLESIVNVRVVSADAAAEVTSTPETANAS
jgi:hypothetical protein